jgi:hypothetical protein
MDLTVKRIDAFLASCGHITPDCPWRVLEQFISEAGCLVMHLKSRVRSEEEADAALARHLDQCEAELGVSVAREDVP